jgi:L-amino acid N-acyltransferase YncA
MLRSFTSTDLLSVQNWFTESETRRWLGDISWLGNSLRLANKNKNRHVLAFIEENLVVAMVDVECASDGRAFLALVVDPKIRRRGVGRSVLKSLLTYPAFAEIREFCGGVEKGNLASAALMKSLGFTPGSNEPDKDGFTDFIFHRE